MKTLAQRRKLSTLLARKSFARKSLSADISLCRCSSHWRRTIVKLAWALSLLLSYNASVAQPLLPNREVQTQLPGDRVPVGVLHSLSGTMAISEVAVVNATLLAIAEINRAGGVLGRRLQVVLENGASQPAVFAARAEHLLRYEQVAVVFGGWTSASRRAMKPVFERHNHLLWYPVQFEGFECSDNIIYSGAQPNQQILPALEWALAQGYQRVYLLGSDYVFPRRANLILRRHIAAQGAEVVAEDYLPLGSQDFTFLMRTLEETQPDIIFNTLNGDSNVAFFASLEALQHTADSLPVMSFSIAEQEAQAIGVARVAGHLATWNYFQSLDNPANQRFIAAYRAVHGDDAVITDPMAHAYSNVYLWKAAVEAAGSFDPREVRRAAVRLELDTPLGRVRLADNQSLEQYSYVGQLNEAGQFDVLWRSSQRIAPQPFDPLIIDSPLCSANSRALRP